MSQFKVGDRVVRTGVTGSIWSGVQVVHGRTYTVSQVDKNGILLKELPQDKDGFDFDKFEHDFTYNSPLNKALR